MKHETMKNKVLIISSFISIQFLYNQLFRRMFKLFSVTTYALHIG